MSATISQECAQALLAELERLTAEELARMRMGDGEPLPTAMASRASVAAIHRLLGALQFAAGAEAGAP